MSPMEIIQTILLIALAIIIGINKKNNGTVNSAEQTIVTTAIEYVSKIAYSFVVYAKNKLSDKTGNEKFDYVVNQVIQFCKDKNIELTEEQIKAIVESSYEKMIQQITMKIENETKEIESED